MHAKRQLAEMLYDEQTDSQGEEPTYLLIYLQYLLTYLLTYLPTYLLTYLPTYLPAYLPTTYLQERSRHNLRLQTALLSTCG